MAARIKLGLVFKYDESWVAGSYYIINLIHALKTLPENLQPEIILFTDREEDKLRVAQIGYKFIVHKKYIPELNLTEKILNKISRKLQNKNWVEKRMTNKDVDFVFMQRRSWETDLLDNSKKIFWIPDCQELMMPELFFKRELEGRKHVYNEMITAKSKILFSSQNAMSHFKSFYPQALNPMYVVNFAVVHPKYDDVSIDPLLLKYGIDHPYFMAPNQFWVHKNHQIVLEAALLLRKSNPNFKVVFTGKENDFRAPAYTHELKQFVVQKDLQNHVIFLGFIPREEQLCLMKNCKAIIQASKFEGWSTVVEDAKALQKWILLSDIPVHREQIQNNVDFFNPTKAIELADLIKTHIENKIETKPLPYEHNLQRFGTGFYEMLEQ